MSERHELLAYGLLFTDAEDLLWWLPLCHDEQDY